MTAPPPSEPACAADAAAPPAPVASYGLHPQDTRLDRAIAARLCGTRTPCEIGLRDASTWHDHTYYVAELHLGFEIAEACHRVERWLVVDDKDTFEIGAGCDGDHDTWDLVEVTQMPPQVRWHQTYLSTGYRRDAWFAMDLTAAGPRMTAVGETVDYPVGGNFGRSWWSWAVPGSAPEGGELVHAHEGDVSYPSWRPIPAIWLGEDFADGAWATTNITACAQTIGPPGRRLSVLRGDTHHLYLEIDDDRRTRGDRVRVDIVPGSECEHDCDPGPPPGCTRTDLCTVEVALTSGKVTGPAHAQLERVDARRTRLHLHFAYEIVRAAAELVDDDGARARVEATAAPRHRPAPVLELPAGLACRRNGNALVLEGEAVIPRTRVR